MKIINKRNFFPLVCVVFTCITISNIVLEALIANIFGDYQLNLLNILLFSILVISVLSLHHKIFNLPFFLAAIAQYLFVEACMLFLVWTNGFFTEYASHPYRDMFISTSVLYLAISGIYFIYFHIKMKRHNLILKKLKKN